MIRSAAILVVLAQIATAQLDATACGRSKGCLFAPQGCNTGGSCQLTMSYVVDGSDMVFELQGKPPGNGYMAIGFSYDMSMGNDSVSLCHSNQQMLAYNQGKSTIPVNGTKHQLEAFTATNGETYCRIRRGISGNGNPQIFNLDQPYTIFLAYGPMNGNNVGYHQMNKWIMPRQELSAYSTAGGFNPNMSTLQPTANQLPTVRSNEDQLRVAHGICMSIGWMVFLSTGILFARFFRDHLPNTQPGGVKMWFWGHRIFQSIGVALTICGFVCIFVANDWRWSGPRAGASVEENQAWNSIHSILGLLSCVIAWAQPLNAVFRCHPGERARFIFDWIHRFFGFGSWLLAAAAIMIACVHFDLMFSSRASALGLFIAFIAAFGLCLIVLQLLQCVGWIKQRRGATGADMEMVQIGGQTRVVNSNSNGAIRKLQAILFIPYIVVAWGTCIAICVLIGLKPKF